ncbi:MAG: hypothetical protein EPN91_05565 [Salinibacterium sp.]|nr:MAG: hypothetical protein EPN91_05565 [Salinibacterium sp.]
MSLRPQTRLEWLQLAWMGFCCALLLACAALAIVAWPYGQRHYEPHRYVFTMPLTQLACLRYAPEDGETIPDWDFQQPVVIDVEASRAVYVYGGRYIACPFSVIFQLHGLSQPDPERWDKTLEHLDKIMDPSK